ncbi:MAG: substrate-binding domain-containing protein [Gammaproteobacteria bacterium]
MFRAFILSILSVFGFALIAGCDQWPKSSQTLKVIAGSELKDIEPMLDRIEQNTGIRLDMHYIGTLDGAEKIMQGKETYDLAWFSHAKYLSLLQGQNKRISAQEKIGLSPVIPGIRESLARQWGWVGNPDVTWSDIAEKVASGDFTYAMSDPTASNSGFSTVMGVQAAFSGSGDAIAADDVDFGRLKQFFSGQRLTSGSSGWLADAYVREQQQYGGLFNYESVLMQLNQSGRLKEPLVLVYPKEGVVTADYPLILLNESMRNAYNELVAYLTAAEFQTWMMAQTHRRPVDPAIKPGPQFPPGYLMELPFPNNIATVNEILFAYLDEQRRPSHSFFVLDISGSMVGPRLNSLKQAFVDLTGGDNSLSGQFARFRKREKVTIIAFNHKIASEADFIVDNISGSDSSMQRIRAHVDAFDAGGGTAIYEALRAAYERAGAARAESPDRFYSIVLMSDGDNNTGMTDQDFDRFYREHSDEVTGIRTFPVLFGEANEKEMATLAERTGGRLFDSRKHSLSEVFKKIRGYQ